MRITDQKGAPWPEGYEAWNLDPKKLRPFEVARVSVLLLPDKRQPWKLYICTQHAFADMEGMALPVAHKIVEVMDVATHAALAQVVKQINNAVAEAALERMQAPAAQDDPEKKPN